jgi:hypothetical protein
VAEAVRSIGVTEVTYYLYGRVSHCKSILCEAAELARQFVNAES